MELRLAALEPEALEIRDDSHEHIGHVGAQGGGGHYSLLVISEQFRGKPRVRRHQLVYESLMDLMGRDIHALAMVTRTPEEHASAPSAGVGAA